MTEPEYKEFEPWFNSNIEATIKEDGSDNAQDIHISIKDFHGLPECMQRGVWEDWEHECQNILALSSFKLKKS